MSARLPDSDEAGNEQPQVAHSGADQHLAASDTLSQFDQVWLIEPFTENTNTRSDGCDNSTVQEANSSSEVSDNSTVQEARAQDEMQNNTHRHPEEERTLDESTKRIFRNISRAFQDAITSERETAKKNDVKINDVEKTYCMIVFSLLSGVLELSWEPVKVFWK